MEINTLGELIDKARKKKGITQENLANYMGVTRQAVNNWINNKSMPDSASIYKICKYLSIDVREYLIRADSVNMQEFLKHEKKRSSIKILIPSLVVIIGLILFICSIIINTYKNRIEVYNCYIKDEDISIGGCELIKSNIKNKFSLGNIETNFEYDDAYIKLYADKEKKNIIFESEYEPGFFLLEDYGYNEYNFEDINNIFVDIIFIKDQEVISKNYKLDFELSFKNKSILFFKKNQIGLINAANDKYSEINNLVKNGYEYNYKTKLYEKIIENNSLFNYDINLLQLSYENINNPNVIITYDKIMETIFINDYSNGSLQITELYNLKTKEYLTKDEMQKLYNINYLLNEIEILKLNN